MEDAGDAKIEIGPVDHAAAVLGPLAHREPCRGLDAHLPRQLRTGGASAPCRAPLRPAAGPLRPQPMHDQPETAAPPRTLPGMARRIDARPAELGAPAERQDIARNRHRAAWCVARDAGHRHAGRRAALVALRERRAGRNCKAEPCNQWPGAGHCVRLRRFAGWRLRPRRSPHPAFR